MSVGEDEDEDEDEAFPL